MDHSTDPGNQHGGDAVHCENCQSAEVDDSGKCGACGYVQTGRVLATGCADESLKHSGAFEIESSVSDPEHQAEIPGWRLELSRRLQELKQKRGGPGQPEAELSSPPTLPAAAASAPLTPPSVRAAASAAASPRPSPAPAPAAAEPPPAAAAAAARPAPARAALPGDRGVRRLELPPARQDPREEAERKDEDIRSLIDRVVAREGTAGISPAPEPTPEEASLPLQEPEVDKLILLTRTFSGLIDLVLVVMLASALVFAVDIIEGIEVFDTVSLLHCLALFVTTFLVYSAFFLATANQTIGMMITDLRVTSEGGSRPDLGQVFLRSLSYLLALGLAGAGLAAGFLDPQARCLHDRLSGTRVIRLSEH